VVRSVNIYLRCVALFALFLSGGELASGAAPVPTKQSFAEEVQERLESLGLDEQDYQKIIQYVSGNEFQNDPESSIDWNEGEDFASLGMGHFIWYPEGVEQKFTESFPKMAVVLWRSWPTSSDIPPQLRSAFNYSKEFIFKSSGEVRFCPWAKRTSFFAWKEQNPIEWGYLISFINHPMIKRIQLAYMDQDFREAIVRLYDEVDSNDDLVAMEASSGETVASVRQHLRSVILSLLTSKEGTTALMDYVNFKGDGTDSRMRYSNVGWGLQQVLYWTDLKSGSLEQLKSLARAALNRLTRRAMLSGREIEREVWIHGWANRVLGYGYLDSDSYIQNMKRERKPDGKLSWPKLHIGDRALRQLF